MKTLIIALALPLSALAAPYENAAGYRVDLPAGWTTTSKPDASPALFTNGAESTTVKLIVLAKPGALGPSETERLKAADEASLKKSISAYRSVPVQGPLIANAPATHYGFLYKDATGAVMLSRFALFSRARASDHQWAKLNAVIPKAKLSTAVPALEKLFAAFRWKQAPAPDVAITEVKPPPAAGAVATPVAVTVTETPPKPGQGGRASGRIKFENMSEEEARAMSANVTEGLAARTEEEKAVARARTFGDSFQDKGENK